jgi:ParB/RepB/Spo0J family partition protein
MEIKKLKIASVSLTQNSRDPERLKDVSELMTSIKENGLLQPIGVIKKGSKYQVLFGHRRVTALRKLGEKTVPAKVYTKLKKADELILTLTENEQREDVSVFEQGRLMSELILKHKLTKKEVAARLGVSCAYVADYVNTFNITPPKYRTKVVYNPSQDRDKGRVSLSVAAVISNLSKGNHINKTQVEALFNSATKNSYSRKEIVGIASSIKEGLNVKQAINKNKVTVTLSVRMPLSETKFNKLVKEFGTKNKLEVYLRKIIKEELAAR